MAQVKEKKKTVTAKVSPTVEKKLSAMAARTDRTISYVINQALEKYFKIN